MPTVRSSVLLPDMFEPLTIRTCVGAPRATSLRTQTRGRDQRMAERLGLVDAPGPDELRERVVRVLRGVGPEGAEGLELADGPDPAGDLRARPSRARRRSGSPAASSRARGPRSARRTGCAASSSRCRSRASRRIRAEAGVPSVSSAARSRRKQRRLERLALQPREQLREQDQVVRPPVDVGEDGAHPARDGHAEAPGRSSRRSAAGAGPIPTNSQPISAAVAEDGQDGGDHRQRPAAEDARRRRTRPPGPRGRSRPGPRRPGARGPRAGPAGAAARSTASCRSAIVSASAGSSSQEASTASPARVRAVQSRSNIEPAPNRSRSAA